MRIAVAGKGGAGKTTTSATLARLAARSGRLAICIDADSNPNLSVALGIDDDAIPGELPKSIVSRRIDGRGPALTDGLDAVLAQHTAIGPDGVRLAVMGMPKHAEEGCMCAAHAVVGAVLADLGDRPDTVAVVDLEASPEHFSRGTARHVDLMLLVAEPYYRSLETVRRMAELAAELPIARVGVVANKIRDDQDLAALAEFCERHGLELLAAVPWSDGVLDADRARVPLVDADLDGPVVTALESLLADVLGTPAAVV